VPGPELAEEVHAGAPGHHHVADHEVGQLLLDRGQRLLDVAGGADAELRRELPGHVLEELPVVVHQQHQRAEGAALDRSGPRRRGHGWDGRRQGHGGQRRALVSRPLVAGRQPLDGVDGGIDGQLDGEGRALPEPAGDGHRPHVQVQELLHQGQADAGPAAPLPAVVLHLVEPIEDAAELPLGDADAGVLDREPEAVVPPAAADRDAAGVVLPPVGVAERVGEEVQDHLLQLLHVHRDGEDGHRRLEAERDVLALRQPPPALHQLPHHGHHVHGLQAELLVPGVEAGEVEQRADLAQQPLGVAQGQLQVLAQLGRQRAGAAQRRLQRGDDQGEGRAELVGDVGEEVGLHPVELDLRLDQLLLRVELPLLGEERPHVGAHADPEHEHQAGGDQRGADELRAGDLGAGPPGEEPLRAHHRPERQHRGDQRLAGQEDARRPQEERVQVGDGGRAPAHRPGLDRGEGHRRGQDGQTRPGQAGEPRDEVEERQPDEDGGPAEAEGQPARGRLLVERQVHEEVVEHQGHRGGQQAGAGAHHHGARLGLAPQLPVGRAVQQPLGEEHVEEGGVPEPTPTSPLRGRASARHRPLSPRAVTHASCQPTEPKV